MSGKTKRNIRGRKRKKKTLDIDLKTFKPRPLGNSIDTLQLWLADSKLAWNQLRELLYIKRQVKKTENARDDEGRSYFMFFRLHNIFASDFQKLIFHS